MDYARMPAGLLLDGTPDKDLVAVVKYQLLWAYLEREPTKEIALRYMTSMQREKAQEYRESISKIILPDIRSLTLKRGRDKKYYYKSKENDTNPTDGSPDVKLTEPSIGTTTHIIEEQSNNKKQTNKQNNTRPQ